MSERFLYNPFQLLNAGFNYSPHHCYLTVFGKGAAFYTYLLRFRVHERAVVPPVHVGPDVRSNTT